MNTVSRLRRFAQSLSTTGLPLLALAVAAPSAFAGPVERIIRGRRHRQCQFLHQQHDHPAELDCRRGQRE